MVTAHYDRVHALCRRMLGNDADALDATQDALVAAIRALSRFDGRSTFGTWLYRIATNTCIDEMRRRRRRPVTGIGADIAETADHIASAPPGLFAVPAPPHPGASDGARDHEDAASDAALGTARGGPASFGPGPGAVEGARSHDPADIVAARVDIDAALATLPVEFRTAVVLRDVCDLPYDEIAEILGVPVGTVRSRIARARSALASVWEPRPAVTVGSVGVTRGAAGNQAGAPDVERGDRGPTARTDASRAGGPQGALPEEPQEEERTR